MYKSIPADKDAYITDKVIKAIRKTNSNVGGAGTLDLFKLYGATMSGSTPNIETSRLLIHFDLASVRDLITNKKIDINDASFWCKLRLRDVYGGQPTPSNFTVSIFPLSASFDEGRGRDVSYYSDIDTCNWLTSSYGVPWYISGCSLAAGPTGTGDYITSSTSIVNTEVTQFFKTGEEDLNVDVTALVSATLSGEIPDSGFRISLKSNLENDARTYFVKRFASRTAYDDSKRPQLLLGFNDSIQDDTQNLTFDSTGRLTLYNYSLDKLTNITSGSNSELITGTNCLTLKLSTEISGGYYNLLYSGSQFSYGTSNSAFVSGTYYADVNISSYDTTIKQKLLESGSVKFTPIWSSNDLTLAFLTGSSITVRPPRRETSRSLKRYTVTVSGLKGTYPKGNEELIRVNVFDNTSPLIKVVRVPVELPGIVVRDAYYQIRDTVTNELTIPCDIDKKSTKISSDSSGMFFTLDTSSLNIGRSYTIDIIIVNDGVRTEYTDVAPHFRIEKSN